MRLELAADYLVMAAWLAYLKSRLLLPEPPKGEEPSAEDLATALALRLRRLEAIREAAKKLGERAWLGRDVFARGAPEPVIVNRDSRYEATLYDLLTAYAQQRQIRFNARVSCHKRNVWSLVDAREALERLVGHLSDWVTLDAYLMEYMVEPSMRSTVLASALSATLEMVREGKLDAPAGRGFRAALGQVRRRPGGGRSLRCCPTCRKIQSIRREADEPEVSHVPDHGEAMRIAEALLFAAAAPLERRGADRPPAGRRGRGGDPAGPAASSMPARGVNLVRVAGQMGLPHRQRPRPSCSPATWSSSSKLSRAAMETLAIIAYHQPVTRAEIEEIRGVATSKGTLDLLLETGWVRLRGRRKAPGRPVTYGTTAGFLEHFGLDAIDDLPGLEELKGAGFLEGRVPSGLLGADALRRGCPSRGRGSARRTIWSQPLDMHRTEAGRANEPRRPAGVRPRPVSAAPLGPARHGGRLDPGPARLRGPRSGLWQPARARRRLADHRAGRDRLPARPFGLRQDHAAAHRRRRRGADLRPGADGRARGQRAARPSSSRSGAASA